LKKRPYASTTLLLLIVQQSASTMTTQVFDQFLRRRSNQMYFGFFVGLAVYTLITLATVDEPFNPVFAATLAFVLTVIALFLLIVLFYATIHQKRPPVNGLPFGSRVPWFLLIFLARCINQNPLFDIM
jgi:hypothetical protein